MNKVWMHVLAVSAMTLFSACEQSTSAPPVDADKGKQSLKSSRIPLPSSLLPSDGELVVVKDSSAWNALWTAHMGTLPAPLIDFGNTMVIAAFSGPQPSSCWTSVISGVEEGANALQVKVKQQGPGEDAVCATVISYSGDMLIVPRTELPVEFIEEEPIPMSLQRAGLGYQEIPMGRPSFVVRNTADWIALWNENPEWNQIIYLEPVESTPSAPAIPEVSFDNTMLVGVVRQLPNGCSNIGINGVYRYFNKIRVDYGVTTHKDWLCTQALWMASSVITLPQNSLPVEFNEEPERVIEGLWRQTPAVPQ